jgi:xanthine dehydrogenase YagR molybdenum-binding subunit
MRRQTAQNATPRDEPPLETQPSKAAADTEPISASTNPGPSRPQAMLYGVVGEQPEHITRQVPADEPPPWPENAKLSAVGKSIPRFDAVQKVTGHARYTFDVQLPGMLYARRVVSTVPHARIKSIDTSAAEKYPGVRAVHVLERTLGSAQLRDPKAEAGNRYPAVRYAGQPLAAVAAETPRAAEAAARLVKVTYAPLPHVTTPPASGSGHCRCRRRTCWRRSQSEASGRDGEGGGITERKGTVCRALSGLTPPRSNRPPRY